jgi:hypothetical protein
MKIDLKSKQLIKIIVCKQNIIHIKNHILYLSYQLEISKVLSYAICNVGTFEGIFSCQDLII